MLEICGGKMNITIGFNVDCVIFKMWNIILATQNVLAVFFSEMLAAKSEKYDINNVYWGKSY